MPVAFMIARQRSGTGALSNILHDHPEICPTGEVFHPDGIDRDAGNYFTFLKAEMAKDPDIMLPHKAEERFDRFLEFVETVYQKRWILIDVKYRSLMHFNGYWQSFSEAPAMIHLIKKRQIPLLNLIRKNTLESWVSGRLAEENKVWHATQQQQITISKTLIDSYALKMFLAACQRENMILRDAVMNYEQFAAIDYSNLIAGDGGLTARASKAISKLLSLKSPITAKTVLVKQAPKRVADAIANIDEIRSSLKGSRHEWMLDG